MSAISTTPPTTPPKVTQSGIATQHSGSAQLVVPGTLSNTATTNHAFTVQSSDPSSASSFTTQVTTGSHSSIQTQTTTSSGAAPSAPVVKRKSKKLAHLSHISAATWIGVGLALGALVVGFYYGEPMWRLARWTALNDFRASCVSDHDLGLQESAKCTTLLAQPATPPPIKKRALGLIPDDVRAVALRWATSLGIPIATLVVFFVCLKAFAEERPHSSISLAKRDFELMSSGDMVYTDTSGQDHAFGPGEEHSNGIRSHTASQSDIALSSGIRTSPQHSADVVRPESMEDSVSYADSRRYSLVDDSDDWSTIAACPTPDSIVDVDESAESLSEDDFGGPTTIPVEPNFVSKRWGMQLHPMETPSIPSNRRESHFRDRVTPRFLREWRERRETRKEL